MPPRGPSHSPGCPSIFKLLNVIIIDNTWITIHKIMFSTSQENRLLFSHTCYCAFSHQKYKGRQPLHTRGGFWNRFIYWGVSRLLNINAINSSKLRENLVPNTLLIWDIPTTYEALSPSPLKTERGCVQIHSG